MQSTALDAFVDRLLQTGRRCFIVTSDGGEIVGLITPHEVRAVARSQWPDVRVADAMRALKGLRTVSPATPVAEVLKIMSGEDVNPLPVVAACGHLQSIEGWKRKSSRLRMSRDRVFGLFLFD